MVWISLKDIFSDPSQQVHLPSFLVGGQPPLKKKEQVSGEKFIPKLNKINICSVGRWTNIQWGLIFGTANYVYTVRSDMQFSSTSDMHVSGPDAQFKSWCHGPWFFPYGSVLDIPIPNRIPDRVNANIYEKIMENHYVIIIVGGIGDINEMAMFHSHVKLSRSHRSLKTRISMTCHPAKSCAQPPWEGILRHPR